MGIVEKVVRVGIKKSKGWLYFIDKDGDVARAKQQRGRMVVQDEE
jgi:hypothetical protein